MQIKKFSQLTVNELNYIIDIHYNYWVNFNPKMIKDNTIYKSLVLSTISVEVDDNLRGDNGIGESSVDSSESCSCVRAHCL